MTEKQEIIPLPQGLLTNEQIPKFAKAVVECGWFPDINSAAQGIIKLKIGQELGLGLFSSMKLQLSQSGVESHYSVIAGLIKRHPKYDFKEMYCDEKRCEINFYEGDTLLGTQKFTFEMAVQKGYCTKDGFSLKKSGETYSGNYIKHPEVMMFSRCISAGVKKYCSEIFMMQIYTTGELTDIEEKIESVEKVEIIKPDPLDELKPQTVEGIFINNLPNKDRGLLGTVEVDKESSTGRIISGNRGGMSLSIDKEVIQDAERKHLEAKAAEYDILKSEDKKTTYKCKRCPNEVYKLYDGYCETCYKIVESAKKIEISVNVPGQDAKEYEPQLPTIGEKKVGPEFMKNIKKKPGRPPKQPISLASQKYMIKNGAIQEQIDGIMKMIKEHNDIYNEALEEMQTPSVVDLTANESFDEFQILLDNCYDKIRLLEP